MALRGVPYVLRDDRVLGVRLDELRGHYRARVADVTATFARRLAAMSAYKSQVPALFRDRDAHADITATRPRSHSTPPGALSGSGRERSTSDDAHPARSRAGLSVGTRRRHRFGFDVERAAFAIASGSRSSHVPGWLRKYYCQGMLAVSEALARRVASRIGMAADR